MEQNINTEEQAKMNGLFITFEGIDGCGKTTQLKKTAELMGNCVVTREPGGTKISEKIRRILLDNENMEMAYRCELLLYVASRAQIVNEFIRPHIEQGMNVLCDRFYDSTAAYQVFGRGICSLEEFELINNFAIKTDTQLLRPDLTFVFDLPVEVAFLRMGKRKADRIETEDRGFFERVRNGFLELASKYPQRIKVIDANRTMEEIAMDVFRMIVTLKEHHKIS